MSSLKPESFFKPEFDDLEFTGISRIAVPNMGKPDLLPLWFGEGDAVTPAFIRQAAQQALDDGQTFYANARGIPALRETLKTYLDRIYGLDLNPDRLLVPGPTMITVAMAAQASLSRGDQALIVSPYWPNIERAIQITGAEVTSFAQEQRNGRWFLDVDGLIAAVTDRTRLIYVNSPCNPSGWVMTPEQQMQLLDFCRARNILLLADEVYHRLVFEGDVAPSFLSIARDDDPLIVVNGFSKSWAMTGWRLGWMVVPANRLEQFMVMAQCFTTGAPTFIQAGGIAALQDGEPLVRELREQYRAGRELVMQRLGAHPRIEVLRPEGAFYAFPRIKGLSDSLAFAQTLVEQENVGVAPGYTFGPGFDGHIRLSFAQSHSRLSSALDGLLQHLDKMA